MESATCMLHGEESQAAMELPVAVAKTVVPAVLAETAVAACRVEEDMRVVQVEVAIKVMVAVQSAVARVTAT